MIRKETTQNLINEGRRKYSGFYEDLRKINVFSRIYSLVRESLEKIGQGLLELSLDERTRISDSDYPILNSPPLLNFEEGATTKWEKE